MAAGRVGRLFVVLVMGAILLVTSSSAVAAQETEPAEIPDVAVDDEPEPLVEPVEVDESPGSPLQRPQGPNVPEPTPPDGPDGGDQPSTEDSAISIIVVLTALALVPTVLIMATSFTRIVIVLGLTRNALGLQGVPPNQVLIGLAVFLTMFVMGPTLEQANSEALQPYLDGQLDFGEAYDRGIEPFREFMLAQVRDEDLGLFIDMSTGEPPASPDEVPITTLAPAFLVSELRAAFIIGFIIFIPFLVVDMIVSATLMAMGMVMLPPVVISLPFKILLFVMVDGWFLLVPTLVQSFEL